MASSFGDRTLGSDLFGSIIASVTYLSRAGSGTGAGVIKNIVETANGTISLAVVLSGSVNNPVEFVKGNVVMPLTFSGGVQSPVETAKCTAFATVSSPSAWVVKNPVGSAKGSIVSAMVL